MEKKDRDDAMRADGAAQAGRAADGRHARMAGADASPAETGDLVTVGPFGVVDGDGNVRGGSPAAGGDPSAARRHHADAPAYPDVMDADWRAEGGDAEAEGRGKSAGRDKAEAGGNKPRAKAKANPKPRAKAKAKAKEKGKGMPLWAKVLLALLGAALLALLGVWLWGRARYQERLFPGVTVDGIAVGEMTADEARDATDVARWAFEVVDRKDTYRVGADDVGFETEPVDFDRMVDDQDENLWFVHVVSPQPNDTVRRSTYDAGKLREAVQALPCVSGDRTDSEDAYARRTADGLAWEVVPEVEGDRAAASVIEEAIEASLAEGRSGGIDLEAADVYVHPLVYSDDAGLVAAVSTANKWLSTHITYDIDGLESVEELTPAVLAPWVSVVRNEVTPAAKAEAGDAAGDEATGDEATGDDAGDRRVDDGAKGTQASDDGDIRVYGRDAGLRDGLADEPGRFYLIADGKGGDAEADGRAGDGEVDAESAGTNPYRRPDTRPKPTWDATFDDDGLRAWLAGIGEEYDTVGKEKTITTPTGKVATISGGGSYGWITDEAAEFDAIKASLEAGEQVHREFATRQRAALPKGQNEWGNTYIEIDLSAQWLWFIRNGEVVLSYGVITGKSGYETPAMVSEVYNKVTDVVLISPWKDPTTGEPTYKTHIDVGLVISDDGGILCHDAPWQPSYGFGSPGYHWSGGSHGCCNMRAGDCWELYNTVPTGTPVVIHY